MLRIALVLSLWHAPIPWIHAHELQGPQVDSRQLLSQHVAEFHARELSQGAERLDWHAHLVLPWCLVHHLPCPESDDSQRASDDLFDGTGAQAGRTASVEAFQPLAARAHLATGCCAADPIPGLNLDPGCQATDRGRHFFATYGRSIGVQELIGLRLC